MTTLLCLCTTVNGRQSDDDREDEGAREKHRKAEPEPE